MPDSTNEKYSVPAFQEKRLKERARVAQLVLVALVAGFVGAGWGYLKGEVAVLSGQSEMASVLLAVDTPIQAATQSQSAANATFNTSNSSFNDSPKVGGGVSPTSNQRSNACSVGGENVCLNKCSAVFLDVGADGKPQIAKGGDCYKENDKAATEIIKLIDCVRLHGDAQQKANATEVFYRKNLCEVDKPTISTESAGATATTQSGNAGGSSGAAAGNGSSATSVPPLPAPNPARSGRVSVPTQCETIAKGIAALPGTGKKATLSSIDCKLNAVVCYKQKGESQYTCTPKPEAAQGGGAEQPPASGETPEQKFEKCMEAAGSNFLKQGKCQADYTYERLKQAFSGGNNNPGPGSQQPQNGVTGSGAGGGMPKPPTGGGSGGGSSGGGGQQQPQCPAGYVLSNQAPQTQSSSSVNTSGTYPVVYNNSSTTLVCVPANQANAQPPQCVFNASKNNPTKGEKITLTWSTTNTDNGGRTTLSDGTNTGRIENTGTQEVTINSARTYTLTAYNAKNETKVCTVAITLGGTGEAGTAGAYPPKLSCAPSIIEKDKSATITWECPTAAKKSAGEGTTTGGDVAGRKTVTPENNTEYTISCYKTETADLDDEESEDFLGKRTCSVRVAEPEFDIIAYPEKAKRGERVRISWGSLFMKTCQVTGPRGFDYTRPNGVVVTEPFSTNEATAPDRTIRAAVYTITCESIFGKRYSADVEVDFQN